MIQEVDGVDIVVDAIQQEVVLTVSANTVGGYAAVVCVTRSALGRHHTGSETGEIHEIALPTKWSVGEGFLIHCRTDLCAFGLKKRSRAGDLDRLTNITQG